MPTTVQGRGLWHLGDTEEARAAACTPASGVWPRAASQQDPAYRVRGLLTDGGDSPTRRRRTRFPGARLGHGLRHALQKLPKKRTAIASPGHQA